MHFRNQLAAPRRHAPADVAELVAVAKISQAFKLASMSALPLQSFFELDLPAANQVNAHALRFFDVGIDANGLRQPRARPSFRDTQPALITHPDMAELRVTPGSRFDRIAG